MSTLAVVRTIASLERRTNSPYGNPRWFVTFTDGSRLPTADESAVANRIDNSEYADVPLLVTVRDGAVTSVQRAP